ncbi:Uncharacterised protein (plasmid) [Mycoplasmopsis gallopavonis]|uniref:Uncharacterized protein n=1 Tax=Mycoplasmopsis gallopavonis TaxID=76629 RepID=A0A449B0R9_9BACT|nr:Uncharacterised protein [Mycoplasmopsis gallopavonis]
MINFSYQTSTSEFLLEVKAASKSVWKKFFCTLDKLVAESSALLSWLELESTKITKINNWEFKFSIVRLADNFESLLKLELS